MTDTYGPTSARQFAYFDPDTSSWRMWPDTGLWGSIEFSATWPRTGYMSGGQAFELVTSVPRITASDCSSSPHLPTPTASEGKTGDTEVEHSRNTPGLGAVTYHFPTPTASDATGGGQHPSRRVGHTQQLIDTVLGLTGAPTAPLFDVGNG